MDDIENTNPSTNDAYRNTFQPILDALGEESIDDIFDAAENESWIDDGPPDLLGTMVGVRDEFLEFVIGDGDLYMETNEDEDNNVERVYHSIFNTSYFDDEKLFAIESFLAHSKSGGQVISEFTDLFGVSGVGLTFITKPIEDVDGLAFKETIMIDYVGRKKETPLMEICFNTMKFKSKYGANNRKETDVVEMTILGKTIYSPANLGPLPHRMNIPLPFFPLRAERSVAPELSITCRFNFDDIREVREVILGLAQFRTITYQRSPSKENV